MKKVLSLSLAILMAVSLLSLAACGEKETYKLGLGVNSYIEKVTNAEGDTNGTGEVVTTVAAVIIDSNERIVKCEIDATDNKVEFTAEGKFAATQNEFKTKYEQGENYGMVKYGNAKSEWFEQVDAYEKFLVGKNMNEVNNFVGKDKKGTDEVVKAGCTIMIDDFAVAIGRAISNAKEADVSKDDVLNLGVVSTQTGSKDATEEKDGVNEVDITVVAAALNSKGKVTGMVTDALQTKILFDTKGVAKNTMSEPFSTKLELGVNYNMAKYGQDLNGDGQIKEWYLQSAEFSKACVGKDAKGIAALVTDKGYGTDELQAAGCTIAIDDMVKAAVKAAKAS